MCRAFFQLWVSEWLYLKFVCVVDFDTPDRYFTAWCQHATRRGFRGTLVSLTVEVDLKPGALPTLAPFFYTRPKFRFFATAPRPSDPRPRPFLSKAPLPRPPNPRAPDPPVLPHTYDQGMHALSAAPWKYIASAHFISHY